MNGTALQGSVSSRSTARPERRPGVHLTGRGRFVVTALLALLLLAAFAVGRSASSQAAVEPGERPVLTQVTVEQGDTLWSVARRVAPQRDPRDVVEQLRRLNHLTTARLQVGQQLLLPEVV